MIVQMDKNMMATQGKEIPGQMQNHLGCHIFMRVGNSPKCEPYSYSQGSSVIADVIYEITNRLWYLAQ